MPSIEGKYKLETTDKFDDFMKALGVGVVMRKMGSAATPTVEITVEDGVYVLKTITALKNTEIKFKIGEQFEETTADGRVVKSTVLKEGDKLIHKQIGNKEKNEKDSTLIRDFVDDGFNMRCEVDDIVCTRFYKRID